MFWCLLFAFVVCCFGVICSVFVVCCLFFGVWYEMVGVCRVSFRCCCLLIAGCFFVTFVVCCWMCVICCCLLRVGCGLLLFVDV